MLGDRMSTNYQGLGRGVRMSAEWGQNLFRMMKKFWIRDSGNGCTAL